MALLASVVFTSLAWSAEAFVDKTEVLRLAAIVKGNSEDAERLAALRKLQSLGPDAAAAAPALIKLIQDEFELGRKTREEALLALAFMPAAYKISIPAMIGQLSQEGSYRVERALAMKTLIQ